MKCEKFHTSSRADLESGHLEAQISRTGAGKQIRGDKQSDSMNLRPLLLDRHVAQVYSRQEFELLYIYIYIYKSHSTVIILKLHRSYFFSKQSRQEEIEKDNRRIDCIRIGGRGLGVVI